MCFSSGSRTHVGKVAFISSDTPYYAGGFMGILRVKTKDLLPKYLYLTLSSELMQSILSEQATGTNIKNLTNTIAFINIPLPPIDIQKEIVNECNKVDEEYDNALSEIDIINQKINDIILPIFNKYEHKRLETLCSSFEYGTSSKSSPTGKVAVVRMGNIQNGKIVWDDVVYSNDPDDIAQYMLHKNDVLFNRTNSPVHVGKSAMYIGDRPAIFAGYLIRINYKKELLNPKYLTYILNSKPIREHGFSVMSKSINQANISAGLLKQYEIPVPSLEQQNIIVTQIEVYEKEIEKAQAMIDNYSKKKNEILDKYLR